MTRPSTETLARDFMRDLITDARCSYRYARAVDRGETGYGSTAAEYRRSGDQAKAQYKVLREANGYTIGEWGEVSARKLFDGV